MVVLTIPALEAKEGGLQIQAQVGQFRDIAALSRKEKKKKKGWKAAYQCTIPPPLPLNR